MACGLLNAPFMKKALLLLVMLGGCGLYWGNNSDDDVCNGGAAGEALPPAQQLIDPSTGACTGWGGGGGCYDSCGPCAEGTDIAEPDWASCYSACSDIQVEGACESTAGCHADYTVVYTPGGPQQTFWKCVNTPPSGAIEGGGCANLDAQTCSEHDDCTSAYSTDSYGNTKYASCANEADAACNAVDCGPGYHCEQECYPCGGGTDGSGGGSGGGSGSGWGSGGGSGWGSGGGSGDGCMNSCSPACVPDQTCANVDCGPGYTCAMECSSGTCYPACIPSNNGGPGDCYGMVTCNIAPPQCPANTVAGVANGCWTGYCIPQSACGPNDPGQCYAPVTCGAPAPLCPTNTMPGVKNGCYTDFCIPIGDCEMPACETITDESTCELRMDCIPIYNGTNCTCSPNGCTCQDLTWERCESAYMPL
jgi:hypothetical protein